MRMLTTRGACQISDELLDMLGDLKDLQLIETEDLDELRLQDILEDLKLQIEEDMSGMDELLSAFDEDEFDEGEFLEQALSLAAQEYERSFVSDRSVANDMVSDDAELFHDCVDANIDEDLNANLDASIDAIIDATIDANIDANIVEMHMLKTRGACQISDALLDMVRDIKDMQLIETEDLDELRLETSDFEFELELSMQADMNKLPQVQVVHPEVVGRAPAPHPKQVASVRKQSNCAVPCMLPSSCFAKARSCGGMPCRSPKKITASPAAWRAQRL